MTSHRAVGAISTLAIEQGAPRRKTPLTDYEQRWLDQVVKKLQAWRTADHEDAITLSRHEVITLLEAVKRGSKQGQGERAQ